MASITQYEILVIEGKDKQDFQDQVNMALKEKHNSYFIPLGNVGWKGVIQWFTIIEVEDKKV